MDNISTLNSLLTDWMRAAFQGRLPPGKDQALAAMAVGPAASPEFGDYQSITAMGLARTLRQAPPGHRRRRDCPCAAAAGGSAPGTGRPGLRVLTLDDAWLAAAWKHAIRSRPGARRWRALGLRGD